jgi:hypothetical protein
VEELEVLLAPQAAMEVVEELISLSSGLMAKTSQQVLQLPRLHHRMVGEDRHPHRQTAVADLRRRPQVKALSVAGVEEF